MERMKAFFSKIYRWFDSQASEGESFGPKDKRISFFRLSPFWAMHIACFAVFWVGWSLVAVAVAIGLYALRMFAITGWYHRYFSHRTFKTGRVMQFLFAMIGNSAAQRGALHWASHHRHHHRFSDQPEDAHSPRQHGFWVSHMFWFSKRENSVSQSRLLKDFAGFPELMFMERFDFVVPTLLAFSTYALGSLLHRYFPGSHTSGWQMLVWGFFISTVMVYHATFSINSLAHVMGKSRFPTGDDSKNSFILALITMGEGWHNNHHHYPNAVRQGFRWWEIDVTYYILVLLSRLGLIWNLKPVPRHLLAQGGKKDGGPVEDMAQAASKG